MGLDSYLNRMKKYKGTTPNQIYAIDSYLDWLRQKEAGNYDGTLEQWCGVKEEDLPAQDVIDFYNKLYNKTYSDWDTEKKYPHYRIDEEVGYWRKANQIHNWFVKNVQKGEDDCGTYRVYKEQLEELLEICKKVLESCVMTYGKVKNGWRYENGKEVPIFEDGLVVIDDSVARKLLPPCKGFFFGSYDIDQYYVNDIQETIDIITRVLDTTDFDTEMIVYNSSW